jgi:hypothetical protein
VRPFSSNASSEADQREKIRAAIINLSVNPNIRPVSSAPTFDVEPLPEYPDKKDVTKITLVSRDELMEDYDMTLDPEGVREKVWRDSCLRNRPSIHLRRLNGTPSDRK